MPSAPHLQEILAAVAASGAYPHPDALLEEAVASFLAARPELRLALACELYHQESMARRALEAARRDPKDL